MESRSSCSYSWKKLVWKYALSHCLHGKGKTTHFIEIVDDRNRIHFWKHQDLDTNQCYVFKLQVRRRLSYTCKSTLNTFHVICINMCSEKNEESKKIVASEIILKKIKRRQKHECVTHSKRNQQLVRKHVLGIRCVPFFRSFVLYSFHLKHVILA